MGAISDPGAKIVEKCRFLAVFDHILRGVSKELTSCITLNALFSENTMFQLSNAVFAECFDYLERFLLHFENQKNLTFWAIF